MSSKRGLGEYLLRAGVVSEAKLDVAHAQRSRWGGNLVVALVEMGLAEEKELIPLVSKFIGVTAVDLSRRQIDPTVVRILDEDLCYRTLCIAFARDEKKVVQVAMADPSDQDLFDQIRAHLQGNVRTFLAGPHDIQSALNRALRGEQPTDQFSLVSQMLDFGEEPQGIHGPDPVVETRAPSERPTPTETPMERPAPMPASTEVEDPVSRLRREFEAYVKRTDRFLRTLTAHLAKQGLLPLAQESPAPRATEPAPPRRTATPAPPQPIRRTATPVPPQPIRRAATPVPPQPIRRAATPVPPPPSAEPELPTEVTPPPSTTGAAVYDLPSGALTDRPPVDDDIVIDAPPGDEADGTAALEAAARPTETEARPRSKVVSSDGAAKLTVGGEIRVAPPADPTASSSVLLRIRTRVEHPVIVVDFGTTRSSVAILVEDRVEVMKLPEVVVLPLPGGEFDMPSVVGFRKDGSVVLGQAARMLLASDPSSAIQSPKRLLGRKFDDPEIQPYLSGLAIQTSAGPNGEVLLRVGERETTVIEACAHVLQLLKLVAQKNLGQEVNQVVLTAPVSFSDAQLAALRRAAQIAGLEVLEVIDEPVGAALSNRYDESFKGLVAVYDFGGGTFDFTVVEVLKSGVRSVAMGGDTWLGGDDIDLAIANAAANAFWRETGLELRSQVTVWQRLLVAAEVAKRELTLKSGTVLELAQAARTAKGICSLSFPITRGQFAEMCRDLIDRSLTTCQETLELSKIRLSQLNAIYVSGGTCYIPAVQQAIAQFFGKVPRSSVPPERAVLVGAALHRVLVD